MCEQKYYNNREQPRNSVSLFKLVIGLSGGIVHHNKIVNNEAHVLKQHSFTIL